MINGKDALSISREVVNFNIDEILSSQQLLTDIVNAAFLGKTCINYHTFGDAEHQKMYERFRDAYFHDAGKTLQKKFAEHGYLFTPVNIPFEFSIHWDPSSVLEAYKITKGAR
jgi:hypothetical protein